MILLNILCLLFITTHTPFWPFWCDLTPLYRFLCPTQMCMSVAHWMYTNFLPPCHNLIYHNYVSVYGGGHAQSKNGSPVLYHTWPPSPFLIPCFHWWWLHIIVVSLWDILEPNTLHILVILHSLNGSENVKQNVCTTYGAIYFLRKFARPNPLNW